MDYATSLRGGSVELEDMNAAARGPINARRSNTDGPPTSFHDILPPELITTSTLSEAGYMGYGKSRFKSLRSSTLPTPKTSQSHLESSGNDQRNAPTRRSTMKKMQGVVNSIRSSVTSFKGRRQKERPRLPTSSSFSIGVMGKRRTQDYQHMN